MPKIRVFHNSSTVLAIEHRADETYTDDNRPGAYVGDLWFEADSELLSDADGVIPFEALRVSAPADRPALAVDAMERDRVRQAVQDRTPGAGGRLDALYQKLEGGTITTAEQREMLLLERGL